MRFVIIPAFACLLLVNCQTENGCTDSAANNFDPSAVEDDGSCEYEQGCTDPTAANYDPMASEDDGSCEYDNDPCNQGGVASSGEPIIDGHTYAVVTIGDQVWFAENLRTTVYANGDAIPFDLTDIEWTTTAAGATAVYGEGSSECTNNSPDIDACNELESLVEYGRLYNWHAVNDARGLCPCGWHIPTDEEWSLMTEFLGGPSLAGGKMKTDYGWANGGNGTNSSGFAGLPGGIRQQDFGFAGSMGWWWSSSPNGTTGNSWFRALSNSESITRGDSYQWRGFSVRCVENAD